MADGGGFNLRESLNLADSLLRQTAQAASFAVLRAVDDPLKLNLPPIVGGGSQSLTPDAATLKILATLYLQAEMEQAGIAAVAEVLTDARHQLTINNVKSANLLAEFSRRRRDWLDRNSREHVFARVFGLGAFARNQEGALINRDFQSKLAVFCFELRRGADDLRRRKTVSPMLDAAVRQAATDLLVNLGARGYGDVHAAARRIQNQLSKAIELLSDESLGDAFQTRGMWNVLRAVLGADTPDFARLTTRGQSGLRLLDWLATILPQLGETNYRRPLLETVSPVVNWAEMWLEATGFQRSETAVLRRAA